LNTFRVKNFETFQHYKDRAPPWIKLYNELLDDYEFGLLPDASKMHLVAIWLLASRSENKIPYDAEWVAKRINATEAVNLELLAAKGFIILDQPLPIVEHVASKVIADCLSREEGQEQDIEQVEKIAAAPKPRQESKSRNSQPSRGTRIDPQWSPSSPDRQAASDEGLSAFEIDREALRFRDYWAGRAGAGGVKLDWAATWRNWVRSTAEKLGKTPKRAGAVAGTADDGLIEITDDEQLTAWDNYARAKGGKSFPRNARGGWRFPSAWPPGYQPPDRAFDAMPLALRSMQ